MEKKMFSKSKENDTDSFWSSVGDLYPIEFRAFNSNTQVQAAHTKRYPPLNVNLDKENKLTLKSIIPSVLFKNYSFLIFFVKASGNN